MFSYSKNPMNNLITKPNIFYLIAIRSPDVYYKSLLIIKRLQKPIYRINLLNALTCISEEPVDSDEIPSLENHVIEGITYRVNNKLHNEKGPAFISEHICDVCDIMREYYFINGKLHNTNGPAIVCIDHSQDCDVEIPHIIHEYYSNGLLHNDNGPAYIKGHLFYEESTYHGALYCDEHRYKERYYKNGKKHRDHNDLPAVITMDGATIHKWYHNGRPYRENNRPTVVLNEGTYRCELWHSYELSDGHDKVLHREDGPARIIYNEQLIIQEWFIDGAHHRDHDRPAVIKTYKGIIIKMKWYQNGLKHRENGPAVRKYNSIWGECYDEEWWVNGEEVDEF